MTSPEPLIAEEDKSKGTGLGKTLKQLQHKRFFREVVAAARVRRDVRNCASSNTLELGWRCEARCFFCRVGLLPQVDVMGDVANYSVLREESSDYAHLALAVMCTPASDLIESCILAKLIEKKIGSLILHSTLLGKTLNVPRGLGPLPG